MSSKILNVDRLILSGNPNAAFTFSVAGEGLVAVVGPNGVGKTTLLRAILGECTGISGEIQLGTNLDSINGLSARELSHWVAYMPQEPVFPGDLRVCEYLQMAWLGREMVADRELKLARISERFELAPFLKRSLGSMSSGERQRIHLARVFLQEVPLLLFDEPTNHLDPKAKRMFWEVLRSEQKERRASALIVTHDLGLVREHCDRVIALSTTGVAFDGVAEEFFGGGGGGGAHLLFS